MSKGSAGRVPEVEALRRAVTEFAWRLDTVTADAWTLPTPCAGWTVRDLVAHVAGGNRMAVLLLDGATAADAVTALEPAAASEPVAASDPAAAPESVAAQGDPAAEFLASAAAQQRAFDADGALQRTCDHPAEPVTGQAFALYRAGDIAVHAWDLARALGGHEALDPDLVDAVLHGYLPWVRSLPAPGQFAPAGEPVSGEPAQRRLLRALGRDA